VFSSGDVLHDSKFQKAHEGEDLKCTGNRDGEASCPTSGDIREFGSIQRDVTRETDSGGSDKVSDNTKHADAAVLQLNVSEAVELFLVAIGNKAKGIEESKRSL
jgi:hypothetical protein